MKITNNNSLPAPLVQAVSRHNHETRPNTISVTSLILPPQIRALSIKHDTGLSEDAADRIWALLGTLLHHALERHAQGMRNLTTEEELSVDVLGWKVIGHYDLSELLFDGELLTDYKLTSVWSVKDGAKVEWEQQLNIYAHLIRHAGRGVKRLQIVAIGRDWSKNKAKFDASYPRQQVKVLSVPLWTSERTQGFIEQRVKLHQLAEIGEWPDCTPEERWAKPTQFALMKKNQKKAVKLFDDRESAERRLETEPPHSYFIVERPGESTRCVAYCSVAGHCKQFAAIQKGEA